MKTRIIIITLLTISFGIKAQDETVKGKLTVNGNIDSGEYLNLVNKGVRHSIFNYSGNSNFYFGAGKDSQGNKKEMIFYNYSCSGGCNIPKIRLLTDTLFIPGKTGIGTDRPATKLHVIGNSQIEHSNGRSIRFDGYEGITTYGPSHWLHLNRYSNDNVSIGNNSTANVYLVNGGGNVGIGTTTPKAKLNIFNPSLFNTNMDATSQDHILLSSNEAGNGNYFGGITWQSGGRRRASIAATREHADADHVGIAFFTKGVDGPGPIGESMRINRDGNVGIGTSNPGAWKLAVNGQIRAKEIKVETGWSDFVFFDDYKLPTLREVENHIKEKGHLKDIPSAKEVKKNGIFLGEMDAKLLQKIEELTLYTIQQEKDLKSQSKKIESLEKQNSKIEKQQKEIDELKLLVQKLLK